MYCVSLSIALFVQIIEIVLSQPDLCSNPKIDSIAFIKGQNQYFFTSGGYYWLLKDTEFPPTADKAKPLPNGFKRGDAAVYRDTLDGCGSQRAGVKREKEVYVVEKASDGNKIMIFDIRTFTWKAPIPYNQDKVLPQSQVDWLKTIDAMFAFRKTHIYVIQDKDYAGVDYERMCDDDNQFAKQLDRNSNQDFNTIDAIDAMTDIDNNHLIMIQGSQYYKLTVTAERNGKLTTQKDSGHSLVKEFFKFGDHCQAAEPQTSAPEGNSEGGAPEGEGTQDTGAGNQPGNGNGGEPEDTEKGSGVVIIVVIVVIVIVVIVIALIAVLVIRKKKASADSGPEGADGAVKSSIGSKIEGGSKVSGSQTGSKMGVSSSLGGTSPSRISVRSKMTTAPSGSGAKSPASKTGPKLATAASSQALKSPVKSSMSKK